MVVGKRKDWEEENRSTLKSKAFTWALNVPIKHTLFTVIRKKKETKGNKYCAPKSFHSEKRVILVQGPC